MKTSLFAAAASFLAIAAAHAGPIDTGSMAFSVLASRPTVVTAGADTVLPSNGSEGAVQTANSLPRGAMDGTVAVGQALSFARFLADRSRVAGQHAGGDHQG